MKHGVNINLLAYNEEDNLRSLIPEVIAEADKCGVEYDIKVIDTENPIDNTEDVCKQYGVRYINQEQPKFGGAFRTAIKYADREYFLILDGDGAHPPQQIPEMFALFIKGGYDIVIGSRYVKGGGTNDKVSSQVMSHMLNFAFRVVLGIKAKDLSTNFRIYHTEALKKVTTTSVNYDVLEEVLLLLKQAKKPRRLRVGEVPIVLRKRKFGESKRELIPYIISYIKTLFRLLIIRICANREENRME